MASANATCAYILPPPDVNPRQHWRWLRTMWIPADSSIAHVFYAKWSRLFDHTSKVYYGQDSTEALSAV